MELLSKLNPNSLGLEIGETAKLGGTVTSSETKQTQYGESTCFRGTFAAQRPDGTVLQSSQLYLPRVGEDLLRQALIAANGEPVAVKLIIGKVEDTAEDSRTGYRWTISTPAEETEQTQLLLNF